MMGKYDDMSNIPENLARRIEAGKGCGSYILNGWRDIILQLDEDIANLDPDYRVDQIKEKFGGLRYYIHLANSEASTEIYDLVRKAEDQSMSTCDVCGQPGERATMGKGFIATRCEEHKE